jgi:prolipoprotein diacylglyceryltransferase
MPHLLAVITPPWSFPVVLHFGSWSVPIHPLCDVLAYSLGFRWFLLRRRQAGPTGATPEQTAWLFVSCLFGALVGAKVLAWLEAPTLYWALRDSPTFWFGGKTIVGGLLGGWAGIELAKKLLGVTSSIGDAAVPPLIFGMCIGRIGCFLTGLSDATCGVPTSLPWGVDFGDGVPRHPAQIYEIFFLLALGGALHLGRGLFKGPGMTFRAFLAGYLAFRFCIDFFKPHWTVFGGLSGIQWGCLAGLLACAYSLMRLSETTAPEPTHG